MSIHSPEGHAYERDTGGFDSTEKTSPNAKRPTFNGESLEKTKEVQLVGAPHQIKRRHCLLFLSGHEAGLMIPLDQRPVWKLGRSEEADIRVEAPEISRLHAQFTVLRDGSLRIDDLGSTNGCFVNHQRVQHETLSANDKIQVGPHLLLKFLYQDDEEIRSYHQLYFRSNRDALTGICNRRYFGECLEREWSYARRHKMSLTLAMLDIDHFKRVNDTYGHAVGDEVLKEFTYRISEQIRKEDLFARHGGEEFVLLLRQTDPTGSMILAERIRQRIAGALFATEAGELPVTVSIGLVTYSPAEIRERPCEDIVVEADAYLYQAKNTGRNCVLSRSPEG